MNKTAIYIICITIVSIVMVNNLFKSSPKDPKDVIRACLISGCNPTSEYRKHQRRIQQLGGIILPGRQYRKIKNAL